MFLLNLKIVFQHKDLYNYFTWTYMDIHKPWVLKGTSMH